ncbi:DUF3108 domain-containing protein [Actomonas aquatica]|uniref:DUF3108 domain-containing protein n=1 Tax=Actomonas aquatica TaxID=2866162 RepID=A0ABZ1C945_9BACT|nr:DUF3108 domain-containing protein [Opitutus sp. WL0086]WRQ88026.1 DUF3108 domain-containing protein [Opitutus sp. WL0086]
MRPRFRLPLCLAFAALFLAAPHAEDKVPVQKGEQFIYRLSWGLFGKAGELRISADDSADAAGQETHVTMETSTRGLIRALYPFDGRADSFYDNESGRLLRATATTVTRTKETEANIILDYDQARATYTDVRRPERSVEVELPKLEPVDFLTTMIQTRQWDIAVGEKRNVSVLFDDEFYELTITAEAVETIKTRWGKKEALILVPRMEENPKGMFKRGGEVRVWVSRDDDHLPLRFEVKVAVGTALAILTDYTQDGIDAMASARKAKDNRN